MHCQHLRTLVPSLLLALLVGATTAQERKCYGVNGELQSADIQPCNADLPAGSHVACCNLAKSPPDICVGGGLCYSQDGGTIADLLVAYGCTDPTGKDVACQSYCENTGALTYNLHTCEDANWCCSPDGDKCCSLKHIRLNPRDVLPLVQAVTQTVAGGSTKTGTAAVVTETQTKTVKLDAAGQTTAVSGATAEVCPKDNSTVVGASVGAVLGAGLVASLIALGMVLRRQRETVAGVRGDGKGAFYPAGTVPTEMDSRPESQLHTSGSTGAPKLIYYTNKAIAFADYANIRFN
ncbi:hypothetical protein V496_08770 [Pseudogymnoascus sp. VKM F-4515 (FW-2607)]|nr:hypothetical protein V496_08770 [Pseudogymnoascus sp. VKM F-4515 (FW-2607)]